MAIRKGQASHLANLSKQSQVDFLHELYLNGTPISQKEIDLLERHNLISPNIEKKPKVKKKQRYIEGLDNKSYSQADADKYIDVVDLDEDTPDFLKEGNRHVILDHETYDKIAESSLFKYQGGREITSKDWKPASRVYHTKDFVNWINSMNKKGFQKMVKYSKFAMYCQQAEDWLSDNINLESFSNREEKTAYLINEIERCKENTLYFLNKYSYYKEPLAVKSQGMKKFIARPVHKVLAYMIDCGYSLMAGKPRQIAATTAIGLIALAKLIFNRNFFIKMIAQDKDKVEEIFDDKIKFPFGELPNWMRPEVSNDRDNYIRLSTKKEKGRRGGVNSKLQVVAPSKSAINGGAPPLVLIDEAGYIGILGEMIREARPTMFMMDDDTGELEMVRQIVIWGTGGEMDKGGKAYEEEFYVALKKFEEGEFSYGIVPLFFDWTTRIGVTKQHYEREKKAYDVTGPNSEKKAVQFRQTYPSVIADMFLTSQKLLVGANWIQSQVDRIRESEHRIRPVSGYFEPVYDTNVEMDQHSDTPYKIIGAKFIPLDDSVDDLESMASVQILMHPDHKWKNRYYQGTDPISTDNGHSKMSSSIYDARFNVPVAVMNYRNDNHKKTFLQCLLLGIYYDTDKKDGVPELVESNIGTGYCDYKESKGYGKSLVYKQELPDHLQGGLSLIGIDNRGNRVSFIINRMHEVITAYGQRFYFEIYFEQLRTFVCKVKESGAQTWEPNDRKRHRDDTLFGLTFSYICASVYSHKEPTSTSSTAKAIKAKSRYSRDANGELMLITT